MTEIREFAAEENHKFVTFEQGNITFAILGMRCSVEQTPTNNSGYVSPKSGTTRSAASPPTMKLKFVD